MSDVFLTFDDGPNQPYTSEILRILKHYGAYATFFICGKNAEADPDSVRAIAAAGHAVGNHAYSHSWLKIFSDSLLAEFEKTNDILEKLTGNKIRLIRPPWGLIKKSVKINLEQRGFRVVNWDAAGYDWWQPPAGYIAKKIIRQTHSGRVILLHDGQKTNHGKNRAQTVLALPIIIEALQKEGFNFKPLS